MNLYTMIKFKLLCFVKFVYVYVIVMLGWKTPIKIRGSFSNNKKMISVDKRLLLKTANDRNVVT